MGLCAYRSTSKLRAHFIPNTHLDREWTIDFQHTRSLTVEFLDNLIDIMKKIPEYHFLLYSQTVLLEDYFEIRPDPFGHISQMPRILKGFGIDNLTIVKV